MKGITTARQRRREVRAAAALSAALLPRPNCFSGEKLPGSLRGRVLTGSGGAAAPRRRHINVALRPTSRGVNGHQISIFFFFKGARKMLYLFTSSNIGSPGILPTYVPSHVRSYACSRGIRNSAGIIRPSTSTKLPFELIRVSAP